MTLFNLIVPRSRNLLILSFHLSQTLTHCPELQALFQCLQGIIWPRPWFSILFWWIVGFISWDCEFDSTSDGLVFKGFLVISRSWNGFFSLQFFLWLSGSRCDQSTPHSSPGLKLRIIFVWGRYLLFRFQSLFSWCVGYWKCGGSSPTQLFLRVAELRWNVLRCRTWNSGHTLRLFFFECYFKPFLMFQIEIEFTLDFVVQC